MTDLNLVTAVQPNLELTGLHEHLRSINIKSWALHDRVSGVEVMRQFLSVEAQILNSKITRWQ